MNSAADEIRKGDWPPVTHPPPPPPPPPQPRPRRGHLAYWLHVRLEPKKSATVQNRPFGGKRSRAKINDNKKRPYRALFKVRMCFAQGLKSSGNP